MEKIEKKNSFELNLKILAVPLEGDEKIEICHKILKQKIENFHFLKFEMKISI
jgi:hypothetical protein